MRRSESACALPRPSATASAKLANSTVNHSQSDDAAVNHSGAARRRRRDQVADEQDRGQHAADLDHEHDRVLGHVPRRQLATLSRSARLRMLRSNSDSGFARSPCGVPSARPCRRAMYREGASWPGLRQLVRGSMSVRLSGERHEVLDDRVPETSAGKKVSAPTMRITADEQAGEQHAVGGEGARARARRSSCPPSSRRWPAPG